MCQLLHTGLVDDVVLLAVFRPTKPLDGSLHGDDVGPGIELEAGRQLPHLLVGERVVNRHGRADVRDHLGELLRIRQCAGREDLVNHRGEDGSFVGSTIQVAVLEALALVDVRQGSIPLEGHVALVEVMTHAVELLRVVDLDATKVAAELLEPVEVDDGTMVHLDVGQPLQHLDRQRHATPRVGGVDLGLGILLDDVISRDRHPHVTQEADEVELLAIGGQVGNDEGVRTATIPSAGVRPGEDEGLRTGLDRRRTSALHRHRGAIDVVHADIDRPQVVGDDADDDEQQRQDDDEEDLRPTTLAPGRRCRCGTVLIIVVGALLEKLVDGGVLLVRVITAPSGSRLSIPSGESTTRCVTGVRLDAVLALEIVRVIEQIESVVVSHGYAPSC